MKKEAGFTLIELIVVILVVGILSYVAVANFEGTHGRLQYETMLRKMAADVRYARDLSMTSGQGVRFYIDETNNRYYLKWADGTYVQNPVGGGDFIIQLGAGKFGNVHITGTAFSAGRLDFNTGGVPSNAGNSFNGTLNLVTLNNQKRIVITANTGFLKIEEI